MITEELARMLREIEVKDGETGEYSGYDNLDEGMKEMYMKLARAYQRYFDMEKKS